MRRWRPWLAASLILAVAVPLSTAGHLPLGYAQVIPPQGDEFNQNTFAAPFQVTCAAPRAVQPCPDPSGAGTWSVNSESPGHLRIWTQLGSLVGTNDAGSNNARNLVLQPFNPNADWTATTSLNFPNITGQFTTLGQTAGLIVYQDQDNFLFLGRVFTPTRQSQLTFLQEVNGADVLNTVNEAAVFGSPIYLRLMKTGTFYQASYSYDNVTFQQIGPPSPAATITQTPIGTGTTVPTATSTPTPTGYTASYASPRLGLFAYGGLNPSVTTAALPADFDWLRIGDSQVPAASPVPTATNTPVPTATATVAVVATSTPLPTSTPTQVPTEVSVPTPTPRPQPPAPSFTLGFKYVSLWYPRIREGDVENMVVQAKARARQGLWVKVYVPKYKKPFAFFQSTNGNGLWARSFRVPLGSVGRAAVTFRLWHGKASVSTFKRFQVVRRRR